MHTSPYRAWVFDRRANSRIRKSFSGKGALAAAKGWRVDALSALNRGQNTLTAVEGHVRGSRGGLARRAKATPLTVLNRSGQVFKPPPPSAMRATFGASSCRSSATSVSRRSSRGDLQRRLSDRFIGEGYSGVEDPQHRHRDQDCVPLGDRAKDHDLQPDDRAQAPERRQTSSPRGSRARRPSNCSTRCRIDLRAPYAVAAYAGLRRGELRGLRWEDVDLDGRRISVKRSWDDREGEVTPKSAAGTRNAPIPKALARLLAEHRLRSTRTAEADFVFGSPNGLPFTATKSASGRSSPGRRPTTGARSSSTRFRSTS